MEDHYGGHDNCDDVNKTCCWSEIATVNTTNVSQEGPVKGELKRQERCAYKAGRLKSLISPHSDYSMTVLSPAMNLRAGRQRVLLFDKSNRRSQIGFPSRASDEIMDSRAEKRDKG